MSKAAWTTLVCSCIFTAGTVAFVHYDQKAQRAVLDRFNETVIESCRP